MESICILSLSPIANDGRVLRQIKTLASVYDLTVAGYGPCPPSWLSHPRVCYVELKAPPPLANMAAAIQHRQLGKAMQGLAFTTRRFAFQAALYAGKLLPRAYEIGYRLRWSHLLRAVHATGRRYDAYHANDWNTLPFAAEAARGTGAKLVVDLHEYAPLEFENRRNWPRYKAFLHHLFHRYGSQADAVTTVAPLIAARYQEEFGFASQVVLSAPEAVPLPALHLDPTKIRIVHHGIASPIRKPELMIETIALCEPRYSLHLMFMPSPYVQTVKELAARIAPGRVFFHDPVPPEQIAAKIAEFDVGFSLIAPTNYNYVVALPNKFFESVVAGLATCIGPSPSMEAYVRDYGMGVIAPSFEPRDLADTLNAVGADQWLAMKQAARTAAQQLNAAVEMQKVLDIYARLLGGERG